MKHKGLIYTLVIVIGVIGIAAILIVTSLGKRGNTPIDVSQTSEESAPHTSVPEVSESNPGTESSEPEIDVIPVASEPPFDPNDPIGNGDIAPDEIPDEDNKVTVVDGTVEDTKKEPSKSDTTVTDVKVKSDKKDSKKEKPDEVGYEVLNDNETEKKEEAKKQKAEKEKQEDKPATVVSVEKSKGTDDDKPVSLIDETENKSEDANKNGNAPVYVNPAKGGPNPFEGGGDTKIEDHDSSEFIGEGDDKPGEGIHF